MIVLGIDPGLATTGYGIIEKTGSKLTLIHYGTLLTPASETLAARLLILFESLTQLLCSYKPDSMAVEELFFSNNRKTALSVSQARGVILLSGERHALPIFSYTPPQIKLGVCGYGGAEKKQVQYMVKQLLNLKKDPKPDDVADGLAIAICHCHSHKLNTLAYASK